MIDLKPRVYRGVFFALLLGSSLRFSYFVYEIESALLLMFVSTYFAKTKGVAMLRDCVVSLGKARFIPYLALLLCLFLGMYSDGSAYANEDWRAIMSEEDWQDIQRQIKNHAEANGLREIKTTERVEDSEIVQRDFIKAFNPDSSDQFGIGIAFSGNTLVVGATFEDSAGGGPDGNPSSNNSSNSGAVYVFVRTQNTWEQQAYLKASNVGAGDQFGAAVDVDGDFLVIGSPHEATDTPGINPQPNDRAGSSGAAYIFQRIDDRWLEVAFLKPSRVTNSGNFGARVGISDNTVVVSAPRNDSPSLRSVGSAFVFVRQGGVWEQQAELFASNPDSNDFFGSSMAVDQDTIVIGSPGEDSSASVVNGDQSNDSIFRDFGAAYVFSREGNQWAQQAYLKAPNSFRNSFFSDSVSISGDIIAVGAPRSSFLGAGAGDVYLFRRNAAGNWRFIDFPSRSQTQTNVRFGRAVSLQDSFLAVTYSSAAVNFVDYFLIDEVSVPLGSAEVPNANTNGFGFSVAADSSGLFVSNISQSSGIPGVNGDESDTSAPGSGAVYFFTQTNTFHSVGGTVTGLAEGNEVVLQNEEDDFVTVSENGIFRFPDLFRAGDSYNVVVAMDGQPESPRQDCMIENGEGVVGSDSVNDIVVDCSLRTLAVASNINTVESAIISVPIQLAPEGLSLAGVSFALDYDPTCLDPDRDDDGVLDRIVLNVPADFETNVFFDPSNIDGEISIAVFDFTQPFSALGTADIATVDFFVDCPAAVPFLQTNIRFGDNPPPSFSDLAGQDVEGTTAQGSVRVWDGIAGDCNVNGQVTIADVISVGREVGDDDGDVFTDAPNDEFFGSPQGCDANGNELITVADAICAHLLSIEQPCSPLRLAAAQRAEWHVETQHANDMLWLQFELIQPAVGVAGVSFDLNFDLTEFDSSLFDLDRDGIPDHIRWPQGEPSIEQLTWTESAITGRLQGLLLNTANGSGQTPANLPEQLLLEVGFPTAQVPEGGMTLGERGVSFSSALGQDVNGFFSVGDVIFQDTFE